MPIEIQPIQAADVRRCAEIEHLAFAESPFTKTLYPGPMPENVLDIRAGQLAKQLPREEEGDGEGEGGVEGGVGGGGDASVRGFKAVDTDLEGGVDQEKKAAIVAWSWWHVYPEGMPAPKPRVFDAASSNVEACSMMFVGMDRMRERLMLGKPCVYLNILATDPKHQRRGAGLQLMETGMQEAARLGVPVYLESSEPGHRLYQKAGFVDIEEQRLDFSKFGEPRPHLTWAMIWEPNNRRSS